MRIEEWRRHAKTLYDNTRFYKKKLMMEQCRDLVDTEKYRLQYGCRRRYLNKIEPGYIAYLSKRKISSMVHGRHAHKHLDPTVKLTPIYLLKYEDEHPGK